MDRFRFRLQKVLELRQMREKETAIKVAEARREAADALRKVEELDAAHSAGLDDLDRAHGAGGSAGEMQHLIFILEQLGEHLAAADALNQSAEEKVDQMIGEFERAFRERRALDQLRERYRGVWQAEQSLADRKRMDELALTRHTADVAGKRSPSGETP